MIAAHPQPAGLEVRAEWQATSGLDDREILRYLLQQHMRQSIRGLQERAAAWLGSRQQPGRPLLPGGEHGPWITWEG
ncbi:MAG TPA: hypothetical protein VKG61_13285 [Streptosporangiaceae bacterium]|nr:hypothetical protein [Streptosporangiaceae bacterium]